MLSSKRLNNIILERNIEYSTYPASKFYRKKVNPTLALRTQRKKDQRSAAKTRSHGLLTCSQICHVLVTVPVYWPWHAPAKLKWGGHFGVQPWNVDFSLHITMHRTTTSRKPQVKIRLAFHERNYIVWKFQPLGQFPCLIFAQCNNKGWTEVNTSASSPFLCPMLLRFS